MRLHFGLISAALVWAAQTALAHALIETDIDSEAILTTPTSWSIELPSPWPTYPTRGAQSVDELDADHGHGSTPRAIPTLSTQTTSALAANYTWNPFDGGCDAATEKPEDCRATTSCDIDHGEYPVCRHGKCTCRQVTCETDTDCVEESICREDDTYAVCMVDPSRPDIKGLCACKPLVVGCGYQENPHTYCSDQLDCNINRHVFSLWAEFGQCTTGHTEGQCLCKTIQCPYVNNGTTGDEYCKRHMTCPEEAEVACKIQWLAPPNDFGGYCTCAVGPYEPWTPED